MPIALFHEDTMHGWGSFIGDNSAGHNWDGSYAGCGVSSRFNSEIEGFIQYGTPPQPTSPTWQSWAFPNSCGNEMYDGPVMIVPGFHHVPRYRMIMHANTAHWVAYQIFEWKLPLNNWEALTDWIAVDVDTGNWKHTPYIFNNAAEGIFIFATDGNATYPWQINISNTQCGWF